MCPCLSSRSQYATCSKYELGLVSPSVYERQNYCFGIYELCPLFSASSKEDEPSYSADPEFIEV